MLIDDHSQGQLRVEIIWTTFVFMLLRKTPDTANHNKFFSFLVVMCTICSSLLKRTSLKSQTQTSRPDQTFHECQKNLNSHMVLIYFAQFVLIARTTKPSTEQDVPRFQVHTEDILWNFMFLLYLHYMEINTRKDY